MNKKDIERRLEAAEKQNLGLLDEIKNLKAQLAEMHDEQEIPDMPYFRSAEQWWYVESEGSLVESVTIHDSKRSEFNCFHTKEYADEFANKCKLIAMMLHCKWHLCRDFKCDYSNPSNKWVVYYGGLDNKFMATNSIHCDYGFVPFDTLDNAQKAADWLNKHYLKENTDE